MDRMDRVVDVLVVLQRRRQVACSLMRERHAGRPRLPRQLQRAGVLQPAGVPLLQHLDAVVVVQRTVRRRVQDPPEDVLERRGR